MCGAEADCQGLRTCQPGCSIVLKDACTPSSQCGNGIIEVTEQCDDFNVPENCQDLGYTGGALSCNNDCTYNEVACDMSTTCNNAIIEAPGEVCDNGQLDGQTCESLGFAPGGTLSCDLMGCTSFDTSQCTAAPQTCGNGVREGFEVCDGSDFGLGSNSCSSLDAQFTGGTLACAGDCTAPVCVNDAFEPNDTPGEAEELLGPGDYDVTLCEFDFDWFSMPVTVGDGVLVRLEYSRSAGLLDPDRSPRYSCVYWTPISRFWTHRVAMCLG
ncbi:MAG: hypothetical protein R3C68_08000 [Myxococcota bacterium]